MIDKKALKKLIGNSNIGNIDKEQLEAFIDNMAHFEFDNSPVGTFIHKLNRGINLNDTSVINELMAPEVFPEITKDNKEQTIFGHLVKYSTSINDKFLNYLIFDYNISEANSIKKFVVDDSIKAKFEIRSLKSELNTELKYDNQPNKKPKV